MVSTPTMHSDKGMNFFLHVSETDVVGIAMLWLELFTAIPTLWVSPAYTIMVRLCDGSQWLLFYAISSCGTVSSSNSIRGKITLAVWRRVPHITQLLYKVYLPITEGFAELWHHFSGTNSWILAICTETCIDIQPCE